MGVASYPISAVPSTSRRRQPMLRETPVMTLVLAFSGRTGRSSDGSTEPSRFSFPAIVMVRRGYQPVVVPFGCRSLTTEVMAGPGHAWHLKNDPAHEWILGSRPREGTRGEADEPVSQS